MALINCPECNKQISDHSPACIQCGYPLIHKNLGRLPEEIPFGRPVVHNSDLSNKEIIVALGSKKSEALAFIFTFFFGPLGLFYADAKKAVIVIVIALIAAFVSLIVDPSDSLYIGLTITFWVVSILIAMISVSEYNSKIASDLLVNETSFPEIHTIDNSVPNVDPVQKLYLLIHSAHSKSIPSNALKGNTITLIAEICAEKSDCYLVLNEYNRRYKSNLIEDLKALSNSYDTIKSYLKPFIEFKIVAQDFPHNFISS